MSHQWHFPFSIKIRVSANFKLQPFKNHSKASNTTFPRLQNYSHGLKSVECMTHRKFAGPTCHRTIPYYIRTRKTHSSSRTTRKKDVRSVHGLRFIDRLTYPSVSSPSNEPSAGKEDPSADPLPIAKTGSSNQAKGAKGQRWVTGPPVYVCADHISSITSVQQLEKDREADAKGPPPKLTK